MEPSIDARIALARRNNIWLYLLTAIVCTVLVGLVLVWLFFVRAYQIQIMPNEARETANLTVKDGFAWVAGNQAYVMWNEASLFIEAPTFESAELRISGQEDSNIQVELLPSPAQVTAKIIPSEEINSAYLSENQWFVNGNLVDIGEVLQHSLPPGKHTFEVNNKYYISAPKTIELERAQKLDIGFVFESIEGSLRISSLPDGAQIMVNQKPIGKSPIDISLPGGKYDVQVALEDYQTVKDQLEITKRFLNPSRRYQLAYEQAMLDVRVSPKGGVLLVNNIKQSPGMIKTDAHVEQEIRYMKPGYSSFSQSVKPSSLTSNVIDITLVPLFGDLQVNTNVPATVLLNGKRIRPNQVVKQIAALEHRLEVSAPGFRKQNVTLKINPNQLNKVKIELLSEYDARRKEGRPLFITELGIKMRAFRADNFVMGSAQNEPGRRRNEHELTIGFDKPFMVAETEITQAQYARYLNKSSNLDLPVSNVEYLDVIKFCNWLSAQEGLSPFYLFDGNRYIGADPDSKGYRLPTEAEWEWLAKKARRAQSTIYVWGNQEKIPKDAGNFADQSRTGQQVILLDEYKDNHSGLAEVASYRVDRNGLYDLAGNVSEWVHDYYTSSIPDQSKTYTDYLGPSRGEAWVIKGGNFETGRLRELRAAYRDFSAQARPNLGFRIARYL